MSNKPVPMTAKRLAEIRKGAAKSPRAWWNEPLNELLIEQIMVNPIVKAVADRLALRWDAAP